MQHKKTGNRGKGKRGINRYNPNKPDWNAVHAIAIPMPVESTEVVAETEEKPKSKMSKWIKSRSEENG